MRGIVPVALASIACGAIASCGSSGTSTPSPETTMDASVAGSDAAAPGGGGLDGSPLGDGGTSTAVDAATACAAYAQAFCTTFQKCNPRAFSSYYFDSVAQCQTRIAQVCPSELSAPGTGMTASALARCAQDQAAQSCADWVISQPASCYPIGSLPNDAGCEYHSQCRSTLCRRPSDTTGTCGSCADRVADGGGCDISQLDCQLGLVCADNCSGPAQNDQCGGSYGSTCVAPVPDGGACDKQHECMGGLACLQGVCAPAVAVGQPCVTWKDCAGDTTCLTVCKSNTHAPVDAGCSIGGTGQCTGSSLCSGPGGQTAAVGTCAPEPTDGKTCTFNGQCLYPATCDQGTCRAPDDATRCK